MSDETNRPKEMSIFAVGMVIFLVALGVGFVVPVFSDPTFKGWVWFLKEYQTLIAGILAVAAAYFTVYQMRVGEENATRRHRQSLKVELRKQIEDVKLIRMRVVPQLEAFIHSFAEFGKDGPVTSPVKWGDERHEAFCNSIIPVRNALNILEEEGVSQARSSLPVEVDQLVGRMIYFARRQIGGVFDPNHRRYDINISLQRRYDDAPSAFDVLIFAELEYFKTMAELFIRELDERRIFDID